MHLSKKAIISSRLFIACVKSTLNFEYSGKKGESHRLGISEIIESKRCGYLYV